MIYQKNSIVIPFLRDLSKGTQRCTHLKKLCKYGYNKYTFEIDFILNSFKTIAFN